MVAMETSKTPPSAIRHQCPSGDAKAKARAGSEGEQRRQHKSLQQIDTVADIAKTSCRSGLQQAEKRRAACDKEERYT